MLKELHHFFNSKQILGTAVKPLLRDVEVRRSREGWLPCPLQIPLCLLTELTGGRAWGLC